MNRIFYFNKNYCTTLKTSLRGLRISIFKNQEDLINKTAKTIPKPNSLYKNEFECILQFRYINHLRLASRLKLYQTGFSILIAAGSVIAFEMDLTKNINALLSANLCMIFALIMLLIVSKQIIRIVGRLYLSKDGKKVLVSHLNFLGKRRDFVVNIEDIQGLNSISELKDTFFKLKMNNMDGFMYMILPYSQILNKQAFLKILKASNS